MYQYACEITRWLDADSVEVVIQLGFYLTRRDVVRLYGVNAPELHTRDPEEKARGLAAKAFVEQLAPPGTTVTIRSHKPTNPTEKFGRWLAEVALPDGRDVARELIRANYGQPYHGEAR